MASGDLRRARAANTAIFFIVGATIAAWSTRIPAVQERLDLSAGQLGLAVLGLEGGAVVGLPAGGALVARLGSRRALQLAFPVYPSALLGVALAPGLAALALVLAVMAAANSIIDVAMNGQGVELERRSRRSLLSGMHAGHSLGLVAGGLAGAAAAAAGLPVAAHFATAAAIGVIVGLAASRPLVVEPRPNEQPEQTRLDENGPPRPDERPELTRPDENGPPRPDGRRDESGRRGVVWPRGPLALLGLIAFCAFMLDGAAYNWCAVHLSTRDAGPALAAAAFTCFSLAVAVGRLAGDRLIARWGRVRVVQTCGAVAAAGSLVAVALPGVAAGLAGWALFGLGLSAIAPAVLGAAPGASAAPAPVAIAAVTTVGYLGSFSGPPVIGLLAEVSSLSAALSLLVLVSLGCALLARPGLSRARTAA